MSRTLWSGIFASAAAIALTACGAQPEDKTVRDACVAVDQRADLCKCVAKKLKANLTDADYEAYVDIAGKIVTAKKAGEDASEVVLGIALEMGGDFDQVALMGRISETSDAAMAACRS